MFYFRLGWSTRFAGLLVIFGSLIAFVATTIHFFVSGPAPMLVAGIAMLVVVLVLLWAKHILIMDAGKGRPTWPG
ncbi:MAG: hypothetical protein IH919_07935 [Deltaproteobacteria bacterium]|nr:hypothetical protein [Deltaproteobacteria bacterium]